MKSAIALPFLSLAFSAAKSIFFNDPDQQQALDLHNQRYRAAHPHPNPQTPLAAQNPASQNAVTLEVEGWNIFGISAYTTPIAVGTPNQVFRAWIGLDFDGLLVRAANCGWREPTFPDCGYGADLGFSYNASISSTHKDLHEHFALNLPAHTANGNVSQDTVHLVDFELQNVTLGAIDEIYGENYFLLVMVDIADAAIGLAPPNSSAQLPYSKHTNPNILSHLLTQSPLSKPVISFTLPQTLNTGTHGSITLGALPSGYTDHDIKTSIPLGDPQKGWNAPLTSLTLKHEEDKPTTLNLSTLTLVPSFSATSGLVLPNNLTQTLYTALHALPDKGLTGGRQFNCSHRGRLPTLTFAFPGTDARISLEERDYTLHAIFGDEEICFLTIMPHERGWEDVVFVNGPLWRKWHVVFDLEEGGRMGLIEREDREGEGREVDVGVEMGRRVEL